MENKGGNGRREKWQEEHGKERGNVEGKRKTTLHKFVYGLAFGRYRQTDGVTNGQTNCCGQFSVFAMC